MKQDPIVEEIRQARAKLLAECDGDLKKLLDRLQSSEEKHHDRVVKIDTVRKTARKVKTA